MAATKTVEPDSFLAVMCGATEAELVSDSLKSDLVAAVFVNLPKLVPSLKGGYFAIKENTGLLDEICFEPKKLLTITQLSQLYPNFRAAKSMPFFNVPGDDEHVKGVKVNLRKDMALNGGIYVERIGTSHIHFRYLFPMLTYELHIYSLRIIFHC